MSTLRQLCDDTSDSVLIENNEIAPDWGCNAFQAAPLFFNNNRITSVITWCSVDAVAWCKQALSFQSHNSPLPLMILFPSLVISSALHSKLGTWMRSSSWLVAEFQTRIFSREHVENRFAQPLNGETTKSVKICSAAEWKYMVPLRYLGHVILDESDLECSMIHFILKPQSFATYPFVNIAIFLICSRGQLPLASKKGSLPKEVSKQSVWLGLRTF